MLISALYLCRLSVIEMRPRITTIGINECTGHVSYSECPCTQVVLPSHTASMRVHSSRLPFYIDFTAHNLCVCVPTHIPCATPFSPALFMHVEDEYCYTPPTLTSTPHHPLPFHPAHCHSAAEGVEEREGSGGRRGRDLVGSDFTQTWCKVGRRPVCSSPTQYC